MFCSFLGSTYFFHKLEKSLRFIITHRKQIHNRPVSDSLEQQTISLPPIEFQTDKWSKPKTCYQTDSWCDTKRSSRKIFDDVTRFAFREQVKSLMSNRHSIDIRIREHSLHLIRIYTKKIRWSTSYLSIFHYKQTNQIYFKYIIFSIKSSTPNFFL